MANPTDLAIKAAEPLISTGSPLVAALLMIIALMSVAIVFLWRANLSLTDSVLKITERSIDTMHELTRAIDAVTRSRGPG